MRCRSVCKSWKELADSKPFTVDHLALQKPRLIARNKPFEYLIIDPQTLPNFDTLKGPIESGKEYISPPLAISSVHGVICIDFNRTFLLWNPSIHRLSRVPLPDSLNSLNYTSCGFWIDPSSRGSKIVIYSSKAKKFVLLSSRNQAWKEVARDVEIGWGVSDFRQVLVNGAGHWIAYARFPWCGVVACFDFVQEKFGTIDIPHEVVAEGDKTNVWKWQESLTLLHWRGCECNLWAMQSGSWSKMFSFKLLNKRVTDVLCVEEIHGRILAQSHNGSLVLYDPEIEGNRVNLRSDFAGLGQLYVAYEFVESLVFPDLEFVSCD